MTVSGGARVLDGPDSFPDTCMGPLLFFAAVSEALGRPFGKVSEALGGSFGEVSEALGGTFGRGLEADTQVA